MQLGSVQDSWPCWCLTPRDRWSVRHMDWRGSQIHLGWPSSRIWRNSGCQVAPHGVPSLHLGQGFWLMTWWHMSRVLTRGMIKVSCSSKDSRCITTARRKSCHWMSWMSSKCVWASSLNSVSRRFITMVRSRNASLWRKTFEPYVLPKWQHVNLACQSLNVNEQRSWMKLNSVPLLLRTILCYPTNPHIQTFAWAVGFLHIPWSSVATSTWLWLLLSFCSVHPLVLRCCHFFRLERAGMGANVRLQFLFSSRALIYMVRISWERLYHPPRSPTPLEKKNLQIHRSKWVFDVSKTRHPPCNLHLPTQILRWCHPPLGHPLLQSNDPMPGQYGMELSGNLEPYPPFPKKKNTIRGQHLRTSKKKRVP